MADPVCLPSKSRAVPDEQSRQGREKGRQVLVGPPGRSHRALGVEMDVGILWFRIGTHAEYERLIGG
jgi:hypothetical protein